jgi:hypothetical protein
LEDFFALCSAQGEGIVEDDIRVLKHKDGTGFIIINMSIVNDERAYISANSYMKNDVVANIAFTADTFELTSWGMSGLSGRTLEKMLKEVQASPKQTFEMIKQHPNTIKMREKAKKDIDKQKPE